MSEARRKSTKTGLWAVTVKENRKEPYRIPTFFAAMNHEAAVEMADERWGFDKPLPPVVKVELVGEVYVR